MSEQRDEKERIALEPCVCENDVAIKKSMAFGAYIRCGNCLIQMFKKIMSQTMILSIVGTHGCAPRDSRSGLL